jgi:sulfur carrier protein
VIYVNGQPADVAAPATIREVLVGLDIDPDAPGIAVAVDSEVATRAAWPTHEVAEGARVEIITATQGG